jgi:hypothetical protein
LEPNTYTDFGGQIKTVARKPINPSRQLKKGVITDLDANGGFNQDLTFDNTTRLLQGFFFADARDLPGTAPFATDGTAITGVAATGSTYTVPTGKLTNAALLVPSAIVYASGFSHVENNGVKIMSGGTSTSVSVTSPVVDEAAPPASASLTMIGIELASASASIVMNGALVQLHTTTDMTPAFNALGIIPGSWVYLGGDAAINSFDANAGFARVSIIAAGYIEFDKTSWTGVADAGAGKSIMLYTGTVIKNEYDPTLIKRRTYNFERTLGNDIAGPMSEYLVGAVPNEMTVNVKQADKVTVDLSVVAVDNEQHTGLQGLKAGNRPVNAPSDAFNTSSDFHRIKLSVNSTTDSAPLPLFAFATDLTINVKNNVTANKAIGVLGAIDTSAGTFEVSGQMTVYFADVQAMQAVRNNADVTLDILMTSKNTALLFDIPLLALGDGRLKVEMDKAITLPLTTNAAQSKFNHTLLFQSFPYLPSAATGH